MKEVIAYSLLMLLFINSLFLNAATNNVISNYYFSHITVEDGLSQSNVKAIIQDSYGFMWFGTKNGLNRYDGTSLVLKNCDDNLLGKGNHNISALLEDSDRTLWVGTDRGVFRYNFTTDIFSAVTAQTEDGLDMNNWVADIVSDSANNIWIVIPDQGVFRYFKDKLYYYELTDKENFKIEFPECICVRKNGEVWVGSWGVGLFKYNTKTDEFEHIIADKSGKSLKGKNINAICDYGDWIAMAIHEGEVIKYNPITDEIVEIVLMDMSKTFVRSILSINDELWVGTQNGLFIVDERKNQSCHLVPDVIRPYSLSDKIIYSLYRDKDDGIWIGTMFGGVDYLPNREIIFDKYVAGLESNTLSTKRIREIAEDTKGKIWIGTEDGGINILEPFTGQVKRLYYQNKEAEDHYMTLGLKILDDKVYCGLYKQGLDIIDINSQEINHFSDTQLGIDEGSVYSLLVDSKGNKWIGTGWGLFRAFQNEQKFSRVNEIGYDWIFDIFEDKDGMLWFATMGSGLWSFSYEDGLFKKYIYEKGKSNTLSSNSISSIMQDSNGYLWFSTDRGGICRYDKLTDNFISYSIEDGLPDDVSYKIIEDSMHNLWFGTNRGLVCFNPYTKYVQTYTTADGLLGNQFSYKSAIKSHDGKFFFGCIEGLISFNPNTAETQRKAYPVYISKFCIYNQEMTVHLPNSPLT